MKQAKVKSKPCTREIPITLTVHDAVVLRAHLRRKNSAEAELLSAIVHEWATHPSRFPGNVSLPSENNVLFKDESLRSYLSRIALATIKAVLRQEGTIKKTALRLGYDRTALHKLISRLTDGQKDPHFHADTIIDVDGLHSLDKAIERNVLAVMERCHGNKKQACSVLRITPQRLTRILLDARQTDRNG
jgi:hypothetical protein